MIDKFPFLYWPRGQPVLSILIYHRVMKTKEALRSGEVDAIQFARQMALVGRVFEVLPLLEAVRRLHEGTLPRRACCITFDDGYADNLTVALPILERLGLPATVFVATKYLDGGIMFNDTIIELIARTNSNTLDLTGLGLGLHSLRSDDERNRAIGALQGRFKYLAPGPRESLVEQLISRCGCRALPDDLMLTSEQVVELARRGVEIGGHTDAHVVLSTLDDATAQREIAHGKARLQEITGRTVRAFAYPNGKPGSDFSSTHVSMVKDLGFEVAVSTSAGVATPHCDVLQLPRFTPWDRKNVAFALRLTRNARQRGPVSTCAAVERSEN